MATAVTEETYGKKRMRAALERNKWKPGQSGNPLGRPRGVKGLAERVRKSTSDGKELIEKALLILRNEYPGVKSKMADIRWAIDFLTDRGFGKPIETHKHEGGDGLAALIMQSLQGPAPQAHMIGDNTAIIKGDTSDAEAPIQDAEFTTKAKDEAEEA